TGAQPIRGSVLQSATPCVRSPKPRVTARSFEASVPRLLRVGLLTEAVMESSASRAAAGAVYRTFIDALNRQNLEAAARLVDHARYPENCVGFTRGFFGWEAANQSARPRCHGF